MREIKFRGKTIMTLEEMEEKHFLQKTRWFEGNLVMYGDTPYICGDFIEVDNEYTINEFWVSVIPESVGQYTGLTDKTGREIYAGDIADFGDIHGVVKQGGWYLYVDCIGYKDIIHFDDIADENDMTADFKVIGNVFEDKHLLEATK